MLRALGRSVARSQQLGLLAVLFVLGTALTLAAGTHTDPLSGRTVNDFLNAHTLIQMATDASAFAIMGVGATIVIISGGIDLSVGAVFALEPIWCSSALGRRCRDDGGKRRANQRQQDTLATR